MKLTIFRTILVAAAALALGSVAYSQTVNIRAQVPFDFVVGDKIYPAGEYAVQTLVNHSHLTYVANRNEDKSAMVTPEVVTAGKPSPRSVLIFHQLGKTLFLYEVWSEGSTVGMQFPRSRSETRLAMNGIRTETLTVAANITH